ncbi:MAG: exosortase/archaeosortase family protein [Bacteroidales bacterium]|nr:exosortase/archaeosortase family protein [Bacteroidales bacterium]
MLKTIIIGICLGILYFQVFELMVHDWIHLPDFSHGFFIPVICIYLVWGKKSSFKKLSPHPENYGLLLLFFGLLLLFCGKIASESFIQRSSLIFVLAGAVWFLLGWEYLRLCAFPILFLMLMIPLPSILMIKITFPLQLLASKMTIAVLNVLSIPAFREGNIIMLPSSTLEVAAACSGIRSLYSLITLGIIYSYFAKKDIWERGIIVLSCVPIAILVNVFRVSVTSILVSSYGDAAAKGFYHEFSGLITFIIALTLLAIMGWMLTISRRIFLKLRSC